VKARAEAALRPKILGLFFRKYNKAKFPPDNIAKNVLQQEMKVPADRVELALQIVKDNGQFVGFIRDTKTGPFVAVDDPQPRPVRMDADADTGETVDELDETKSTGTPAPKPPVPAKLTTETDEFKVFISHGKNMAIVDQVKDVLELYDIDYEIAVEEETTAIPVPTKVMASMRRCQAGIVVVTADEQNKIGDGYAINTNVLIEIGAGLRPLRPRRHPGVGPATQGALELAGALPHRLRGGRAIVRHRDQARQGCKGTSEGAGCRLRVVSARY
jgi:hypothetical protein